MLGAAANLPLTAVPDLKGTQAFKCLPISASGVMRMTMAQMTQYDDTV